MRPYHTVWYRTVYDTHRATCTRKTYILNQIELNFYFILYIFYNGKSNKKPTQRKKSKRRVWANWWCWWQINESRVNNGFRSKSNIKCVQANWNKYNTHLNAPEFRVETKPNEKVIWANSNRLNSVAIYMFYMWWWAEATMIEYDKRSLNQNRFFTLNFAVFACTLLFFPSIFFQAFFAFWTKISHSD